MSLDPKIEEHIDNALLQIRQIFVEAATRIEALGDNEKVPATKLAEDIASNHGIAGPQLYPTLKFLLNKYPEAEITRGAHGGIRKVRATKPSP